jgi:hypothetical protein
LWDSKTDLENFLAGQDYHYVWGLFSHHVPYNQTRHMDWTKSFPNPNWYRFRQEVLIDSCSCGKWSFHWIGANPDPEKAPLIVGQDIWPAMSDYDPKEARIKLALDAAWWMYVLYYYTTCQNDVDGCAAAGVR